MERLLDHLEHFLMICWIFYDLAIELDALKVIFHASCVDHRSAKRETIVIIAPNGDKIKKAHLKIFHYYK